MVTEAATQATDRRVGMVVEVAGTGRAQEVTGRRVQGREAGATVGVTEMHIRDTPTTRGGRRGQIHTVREARGPWEEGREVDSAWAEALARTEQ